MKKKAFLILIALLLMISACTNTPTTVVEKTPDQVPEVPMAEKVALENFKQKIVQVPYNPTMVEANVAPYKVNKDLSNIENLEQFGEFSNEQLELIIKNNFVVNPTKQEQLFYIYEDNMYNKMLPNFITTDSVLQVYHIFYNYTLRTLESEKLIKLLEQLTEKMLLQSIELYNGIENATVKDMQLKNISFFAVAQLALKKELPLDIPEKARAMAQSEMEKINAHGGFEKSSIFSFDLDYSQYTIRGHYTRSDDFARYFKTMMWYGQAPFPLYIIENEERNVEQTLQALLITYSILSNKGSFDNWENIYESTNFFVGNSDDLDIYNYADLLFKVYGNSPDLNTLADEEKLDELYEEAKLLPEPKIKAKYTLVSTPTGKQFRFMGQRYVMDAEIIQELTEPIVRPIPSGLDVMGVLGSERAKEIQMSKEENQHWNEYPKKFEALTNRFSKLTEKEWQSNMYQGWMWTLKDLNKSYDEGYPSFMTNNAWVDKNLNTALGSWSELKHDTILYGKQSGAEMGGGDLSSIGYVEPNIGVYEKLLWLTRFSRANLNERGLIIEAIDEKMGRFEDLLQFLINCSIKELNNEVLTEDEYMQIAFYGGTLEGLSSSFAGDGIRWFEITSDTDKNMAVIADFHTIAPNEFSDGGYMEAGVGPAYEIYVVVPIDGKLYLTRGAVFSYHEFISTERLTDESWQQMIKEDKQPPMPEWTDSFIRSGKGEIPVPEY
ncbi:DUF3160 domain-containing protein [Tissierella sp. Yu-01]|uniref:DUF3160 domain-containing protein n=1 Tax=Tissierella sp. Yu-01 TaxID=3035694 RepID=UPI00240D488C|nr:DUF3160 domain-containing protein [Tissierella sp. Yu-01]WFA08729.1 DUF3160 domain-containing protein [Tissierella sp. Yu-01]